MQHFVTLIDQLNTLNSVLWFTMKERHFAFVMSFKSLKRHTINGHNTQKWINLRNSGFSAHIFNA